MLRWELTPANSSTFSAIGIERKQRVGFKQRLNISETVLRPSHIDTIWLDSEVDPNRFSNGYGANEYDAKPRYGVVV